MGVPTPNPKPKKPTSIRIGKTMRALDSHGRTLRIAPFLIGALLKTGIRKIIPHNALAKTRLNNHSTDSSGAMLKPSAGVTPNAPNDHTTKLFTKPPSAPAMSTKSIFLNAFIVICLLSSGSIYTSLFTRSLHTTAAN